VKYVYFCPPVVTLDYPRLTLNPSHDDCEATGVGKLLIAKYSTKSSMM